MSWRDGLGVHSQEKTDKLIAWRNFLTGYENKTTGEYVQRSDAEEE
jgi:hypothetical protein